MLEQTLPRPSVPLRLTLPAPVLAGGHSINKNLLQLIRLQPLVRVGLVHDRNASEVSGPSTGERTGTTAPTSKAILTISPASKFN
jgi:hypothetical protein